MLDKKQDQRIESQGTGVQAGRDVHIVCTTGLSASDVRELCRLYLKDSFSVLREHAQSVAQENVEAFAKDLEDKLIEKSGDVVLDKLRDPDAQAAIRDAVVGSARRGKRGNTEVLVDLLAERISPSNSEYIDLVISEAITVVPRVTRPQICHLSFIHFMTRTGLPNLQRLDQLEGIAHAAWLAVSAGINISESQKKHMEYAGVCTMAHMMSVDIYKGWMESHGKPLGYTDVEDFKRDIRASSPSSNLLLEAFEAHCRKGEMTLTSVGQAIAIANLSTTIGRLDYSVWLN